MKLLNSLKFLQILLMSNFVASQTDYCSTSLCSGWKHIACENSGDFDPFCPPDRKILDLYDEHKQLIVDEHNKLRNKIASGQEIGFNSASMMSTMVWNDELAKLAELNAKTCRSEHDNCRNTDKFHFAGQNIALSQSSPDFGTLDAIIINAIQNWYAEAKIATQSEIDSYFSSDRMIGHFTQIVNDLSNEVGCAVVQYTENDGWKSSLFVCDYARTNIIGFPVYVSGDPASQCNLGINPNYEALCSINEVVDPNSIGRNAQVPDV
ncbi:venom allergen-1-like [Chironomus tepperi]|uniref:venom allergen-1-like n=1 Tax=Chironomus tepperi TaxID=113505 RepID=UPI00391F2CFB